MVTLFLSGDVMLGRGIDQILPEPCDPQLHESYVHDAREYVALAQRHSGAIARSVPLAYPWGDALAMLDDAAPDLRIINLETSITCSQDHDRTKGIHYRMSPANAASLSEAKIDVCVLANNHILDWGQRGLLDTLDTLAELGIRPCGAGRNLAEAEQPVVIDLGARGRVVVFALGDIESGVPEPWQAGSQRPGIALATALDDTVAAQVGEWLAPWRDDRTTIVVSIHWGENWGFLVPREHRRFAHRLVEHGADVVHGHSSHHVKGIEVYHGRLICYGAGDLITDYEGIHGREEYRCDLSLLYLATVEPGRGLRKLEMMPMRISKLQLHRATGDDVAWLAETVRACGETCGTSVEIDRGRLSLIW